MELKPWVAQALGSCAGTRGFYVTYHAEGGNRGQDMSLSPTLSWWVQALADSRDAL